MKKQRLQHWILAADLTWSVLAFSSAYLLKFGMKWHGPAGGSALNFIPPLVAALILWTAIFCWMRLDGFRHGWDIPAVFSQLILGVGFLVVLLFAVGYLARVFVSRIALIYFGALLFLGLLLIRFLVYRFLGSRYVRRTSKRVVIVGNGPVAREMAAKLASHPEMLCQIVGFLASADAGPDSFGIPTAQALTVQTLGIVDLFRQYKVDEVVMALPRAGLAEVVTLVNHCRKEGIAVSVVPYPYELYLSKPQLLEIDGLPVLQLGLAAPDRVEARWKRGLDLLLGFAVSWFSLPFVFLGVILLLGKKGGPLCREIRCGQAGKPFLMWRLNSDRDCSEVPTHERILQHLSITELPQLWNVLRGEMSLVGPRPEPPERVKHYSDWQRQRLKIRPGMTGLAQVHGLREQHSSEEKARFDLQYMMRPSLFLDLSLLLQTVWTLAARVFRLPSLSAGEEITIAALEGRLPHAHSTQPGAD